MLIRIYKNIDWVRFTSINTNKKLFVVIDMTSCMSLILKAILLCLLSIDGNLNTGALNNGVAFMVRSVLTESWTSSVSASYLAEGGTEGNGTYLDILYFFFFFWTFSLFFLHPGMAVLLDTCGRRSVKRLLLYLLVVPLLNAAGQSYHQPCSLMIEITVFISLPTADVQPEQLGCVFCSSFCRIIHYLVTVACCLQHFSCCSWLN